jgi:hypothetical protein
MIDGNTYALDKYMEEQEHLEKLEELYLNGIQEDIKELEEIISRLRYESEDYEGYSMRTVLDEELKELL